MTFIPSLTFTELWVVFIEHLQRMWHASRERLPFRTPGSAPTHFWTCLCSKCWDQIPWACQVFTRLFTLNNPWYFLDYALICFMMTPLLFHICMPFRGGRAIGGARYGQGTGPIILDDVACRGREATLLDCSSRRLGSHNCGHHEDASVECQSMAPSVPVNINALPTSK